MKEKINVFDYSKEILTELKKGILVTTKSKEKVNSMTVSWGHLGIEWNKPLFIIYIRQNRFTKFQLDLNPEFTVNIPLGNFDKNILSFCGTKSGHNVDKIKELNLTLEEPNIISVPGIAELPLTLECRIVYKQTQDQNALQKEDFLKFYPKDIDSSFHGSNKDIHTAFYGEILDSYIIK